jgi:hypothetical protein
VLGRDRDYLTAIRTYELLNATDTAILLKQVTNELSSKASNLLDLAETFVVLFACVCHMMCRQLKRTALVLFFNLTTCLLSSFS